MGKTNDIWRQLHMENTNMVAETLRNVGLSPKYKGYVYALHMLCLSMDDFTRVHNMTTQSMGIPAKSTTRTPAP